MFTQIQGLEALQRGGLIHRDLKPANILIGSNDRLKIADLGLAREEKDKRKGWGGTLDYIAPEIYRRESYGYAADVWSAGIVIFELLVGKVRWVMNSPRVVRY